MSAQVAGPKMPPPMNFKAPAIKPPAAPAVAAPQTGNKLVLLFVILGVLAILLIVLIILLLKK
jgi:LPXTG-motif cell wall-anchored protein